MKYVFVGDLHGKWEYAENALQKDGHVIYVGDYVDSFDRSIDDQEKCLNIVLDAVQKGKASALFGNHELSYILPSRHRCSGYNLDCEAMMIPYKNKMLEHFDLFKWIGEDWIITHAGLHPKVFAKGDIDQCDLHDDRTPEHWIGKARGGLDEVGGIWWCDYNREFKPIDCINQVFGHTAKGGYDIRTTYGNNSVNYCVDCLDKKEVYLELDI